MRHSSKIAAAAALVLLAQTRLQADVVTEWDQLASNAIVADIPTNVYAVNNPTAPVTDPSTLGPADSNVNPNAATRDLALYGSTPWWASVKPFALTSATQF